MNSSNGIGVNDGEFIAHVRQEKHGHEVQAIKEHCKNTAKYCSEAAKALDLEKLGYYVGILHDAGKFSDEFQEYIKRVIGGKEAHKGSVNHTFAAVAYTLKRFHAGEPYEKLTAELAAWAMGSHHGIFDINGLDKRNGFEHRIKYARDNDAYQLSMQRFFENCISENELGSIFLQACDEVKAFNDKMLSFCKENLSSTSQNGKISYSFLLGMTARILLSVLIDADRNDTYEFINNKGRGRKRIQDKGFWRRQLKYLEERLEGLSCDTEIDRIRRDISDRASEFAGNMPDGGIFRLNAPTGAGKTLTSFRAALSAAVNGNVSRIIYVLPLLSIIDQNARVIKQYSYDAGFVTEHHSNVIKENMTEEELDQYELICESWDNAVIVTTLVEFLNALFSGKTQSVRRMNALVGAVVIIDEVQTVPLKMLYMFNNALNFLAYCCGCKIILCSAPQPCFEKTDYMLKYSEHCDIVKINESIKGAFRRTKIIDKTGVSMSVGQLCDFSMELMKRSENLLIICNTKSSARGIFREIQKMSAGKYKVFCMTANMCMKHRQIVLRMINHFLKKHAKMICVSTQLVEAGVDFSFETLIRLRAGLDHLAQAAGRCNRGFEYGHICSVYMVRLIDEKLSYLKDIQNSQNSVIDFLYQYHKNPENFDHDILSEKSVEKYYNLLFGSSDAKRNFSYPVKKPQQTNIFNLLTLNRGFSDHDRQYFLKQAFREAGELFEVFGNESFDVIVPFNRAAKEIIANINSEKAKFDIDFLYSIVQRAKPYMVSLFEYQIDRLLQVGMLQSYDNGHIYSLHENCYNRMTGLEIV